MPLALHARGVCAKYGVDESRRVRRRPIARGSPRTRVSHVNPSKQADRCGRSLLRTLRRASSGFRRNGRRRSGFQGKQKRNSPCQHALTSREVDCYPATTEIFREKSAILVNDADTYVACGLAGLGLIQGSTFILDAHVRFGRLSKVLRDYPLNPRPVSVVYMPNRTKPRRVDIFIDWLIDSYSIHLADQS
ncbi:LysR substrate-binding domain-containing protein [Caballeronia sp. SEWSISQ10-4 2]|uniref:LysR substrate-binding domain-containing protein n=1 Tax=Caballeronia sp. SEWSISQ10-4 2 TaxID=2937438 RepID=UPI002655EFF9|nr:LysR substrate-binding domain-containing protein [Caballeronia sp. SEWSISQ10-4 2]MDN7183047.1 LysR substrate-binding domain-containing protein [Caballeronia sp. SEWSISQ10-4 2]